MQESKKNFFGKNDKKWKWETFKTTKGFKVSDNLLDWIIGQDEALEECKLSLDEWINKLKYLRDKQWWKAWENPETEKPTLRETPAGPYLLLLGNAGTGKSLIGKALASHLTTLYKKHNIPLHDVVVWRNKIDSTNPKISCHLAGEGRKIIQKLKEKAVRKNKWSSRLFRTFLLLMGGLGGFITGYTLYDAYQISQKFGIPLLHVLWSFSQMLVIGFSLLGTAILIFIFGKLINMTGGTLTGIGGTEASNHPKLLVDNSQKTAPFIDATGHGSSQLYGSIVWDPYQSGGLGTPEHQRVVAGDVHKAHLGVLFIDEIKNLHSEEAVTLLTVLEDGQLPIALRSAWNSGNTAALCVATEPIPCMCFFVGAGNYDSIPHIHPALMDRIRGYGKVVKMNDAMPNTVENRRKFVQFIAQESKRFNLLPFSRDACIEVVEEARRRSEENDMLTCRFRPLISVLKTASILASNRGCKVVEAEHVKEAIREHCKSIERQLLEEHMSKAEKYTYIYPKAPPTIGQIHGLTVSSFEEGGEGVGSVTLVKATTIPKKHSKIKSYVVSEESSAGFVVTGVAKERDEKWIFDSISKVKTVILQLTGVDLGKDLYAHLDFSQSYGVDGPSAGITMTLVLLSCILKLPVLQDVAVTGEINIDAQNNIIITPVGGLHEKISAAEKMGFKKVVIPKKNFDHSINPSDYKIKVVGAETLEEYMEHVFGVKVKKVRKRKVY